MSKFEKEFKLASFIQKIFERTIVFLMTKKKNARYLKFLFIAAQAIIRFVLIRCNITIFYLESDQMDQPVAIMAVCSGGTLGFIHGWFAAGFLLGVTPAIVAAFIIRSFFQQYMHDKEYKKLADFMKKISQDKEFKEKMIMTINESIKQIDKRINQLKLENLNWNRNPDIKQAAERLGIFENPPEIGGPLHIESLDGDLEIEEMLKNLGLIQEIKAPSVEELNEFLKSNLESNSTTIKTIKDIIPDTLSGEDEIEIS